jgi:hypothetical protein
VEILGSLSAILSTIALATVEVLTTADVFFLNALAAKNPRNKKPRLLLKQAGI